MREVLKGLSVLLAEDNATNQLVAVQMLEALGARVAVASDGEEALRTLETARFDVLLIDIEMPRVSGIEVIRRLRRPDSPHAATPTIALTAYVMHEHRRMIAAAGADGIIPKPIMSVERFGEEIAGFVSAGRRHRDRGEDTGPRPQPATGTGVDREVLRQLEATLGSAALREVLCRAVTDIDDYGTRLADALREARTAEARAAAHVLVGIAGVIGAHALEAVVREVEAAEGAPPADAGLETRLDAALRETLLTLREG